MRIADVRAYPLSYPIAPQNRVALGIGTAVKRDAVLVRIRTDEGLVGWGEAHHGRAHTAVAKLIETTLSQLIVGMEADDPAPVWEKMYRFQLASHGMGAGACLAISGIDMALWDIRGKALGVPLYRVLGGTRKAIPAYAGGVSLGYQEKSQLIGEARASVDRGYTAIKLRVGDSVERDIERMSAIRETFGKELVILTDANIGYALEQVRLFRDRGLPAYAETCPQYLFLSVDNYDEPGFDGAKYVMSPPLREKWHQDELWKGLARNDLQVISTDHCPFCMKEGFQGQPKQKELGIGDFSKIPNGAPGVETRMYLTYDGGVVQGRITLNRWVEVTSTTPAKIMGMFPKKGTIAVGSDADIVIWDPRATHTISAKTHHMRVDYNPYEGRKVKGKPALVMSRGEVIVDKDKFLGRKGRGRFIKRGSPILQT